MRTLYLISPYSDPSPEKRLMREVAAEEACAALMGAWAVYSPIVHHTRLARVLERENFKLPTHEQWMEQDLPWLRRADVAFLLPLGGWRESKGVQQELRLCSQARIPIYTTRMPSFQTFSLDNADFSLLPHLYEEPLNFLDLS